MKTQAHEAIRQYCMEQLAPLAPNFENPTTYLAGVEDAVAAVTALVEDGSLDLADLERGISQRRQARPGVR